MFDKRMLDFSGEGGEPLMMWVFAIYLEFQRFVWEWPEKLEGTKEQRVEMRQLLRHVIGWMPTDIIPVMKQSIVDQRESAIKMMESAGDTTSPAAQEVLAALNHAEADVDGIPDTPILDYLKRLKQKQMAPKPKTLDAD